MVVRRLLVLLRTNASRHWSDAEQACAAVSDASCLMIGSICKSSRGSSAAGRACSMQAELLLVKLALAKCASTLLRSRMLCAPVSWSTS
jgi:hypothetical protein